MRTNLPVAFAVALTFTMTGCLGPSTHPESAAGQPGDGAAAAAGSEQASGVTVGYAMTSGGTQMSGASEAYRWGRLRDSDPFVGSTTNVPQPNFCVSFEMPVP